MDAKTRIAIMEVLNDNGFSIIYIDDTYYSFISFTPADNNTPYTSLNGCNISSLIETSTTMTGFSESQILHLVQTINAMPNRIREFSPDKSWVKYVRK